MSDSSFTDAGQPNDAPDAATSRDAAADATNRDAAEPPPDPCPMNEGIFFNCDPNCDPATRDQAACAAATCKAGGTLMSGSLGSGTPIWVIRTPQAPGRDSTCSIDCPSQPWAYGLSANLGAAINNYDYTVTVSPPWYLIGDPATLFCAAGDAAGPTSCLWFNGSQTHVIYIVTADPNAPARNVTFQQGTPASCP